MELAIRTGAPATVRTDTLERSNVQDSASIYVQCIPSNFLSQANTKKYFKSFTVRKVKLIDLCDPFQAPVS